MSSLLDPANAPYRPGWPFLGNALQADRDPCHFFADGYRECGPVFRVTYPGRDLLVLAGLEANELLATGDDRFDAPATYARVTRELGTDVIPNAADGARHRELRGVLAPSMSTMGLEAVAPRLIHEVVERVRKVPPGATIGVREVFEPLLVDLVGLACAGTPLPPGLHHDLRRYATWMGAIGVGGAFPEALLYSPPMRSARRKLDAFVAAALDDHRARGPGLHREPDILDAILAFGRRNPDLPEAVLRVQALLPFKNAGIYLYRLLSFVLWELTRHPGIRERLAEELDGVEDLEGLRPVRLARDVVHEALRLWPMAIALPRVVKEPFQHLGYAFQPGQTLYVAGPVTHYDPALFGEPDRFDPDRFGPVRNEHRRPYAYAPFGLGRHACLARNWTVTMVSIALVGLLRERSAVLEPAGYELRLRAFPDPIPEAVFRMRLEARTATKPAVAPRAAVELSAALVGLDSEARERVFADLIETRFDADTVVFREGDEADRLYVIREGQVEVSVGGRRVATLGNGEVFGEVGLLQEVPRTATVRAITTVRCLSLGRAATGLLAAEGGVTRRQLARVLERRMAVTALVRVLPAVDLDQLDALGQRCERLERQDGEFVIQQGELSRSFFLLVAGAVEVSNVGPTGETIVVAELVAPDGFGEIGLLEGRPRTANVRARGAATLFRVDRETFLELVGSRGAGDLAEVASARLLELYAKTTGSPNPGDR